MKTPGRMSLCIFLREKTRIMILNRQYPLQERKLTNLSKKWQDTNSLPESEGKKETSVAKKQVAKKPKLAEKESG